MFSELTIQPVLLETVKKNGSSLLSYSAILLQETYIISTSHILQDVFGEIPVTNIEAGKLFICSKNIAEKLTFNVVASSKKDKFRTQSVCRFGFFKCKNISEFFENDCKDFQMHEYSTNLKEYVSIFLIFCIKKKDCTEHNLKMILYSWIQNISENNMQKGENIMTVSSPFGNRIFFNTVTEGIVSNEFKNSSILLSDCCSAPGSEGGAAFKRKSSKIPIGIIISPFNWWRKDWVGFTLIADIKPIILQILDADKHLFFSSDFSDVISPPPTFFENCVAQVCCGINWGSCILIDQNKGLFLTNSHVVNPNFQITIFWKHKKLLASLIYQSVEGSPLDLAIVKICENNRFSLSNMSAVDMNVNLPNKGDPVYCVGYPLFSTSFKPNSATVTKGIISAVNSYMIKTTCSVYPGFSGGGVFSPDGRLLGIIVSNTRIPDVGVVYPRINMAVPFHAIAEVLIEFLQTGDINKLKLLDAPNSEASRSWMPLESKL